MLKAALPFVLIAAVTALSGSLLTAAQQGMPPGHPQTTPPPASGEMPPGHPPTATPAGAQMPPGHPPAGGRPTSRPTLEPPPPAAPEDVESIDAVITAYYDSISGAKGVARDWNRFRSIFNPEARLMTSRIVGGRAATLRMSPDQFIQANQTYFERGGYFEKEIHRHVDAFGNIAHVFSTYESRQIEDSPEAYSRGVNSFQLLSDGTSWWIVNVMWDFERADNPIPGEMLPPSGG